MTPLTELCDLAKPIFMRHLTKSYHGLEPDFLKAYETPPSLTREEKDSFSKITSEIITNYPENGQPQLFETIQKSVTQFVTNVVFPDIQSNLREPHFCRAFNRMAYMVDSACERLEVPSNCDYGVHRYTMYDHIISVMYSNFSEAFLECFFSEMRFHRMSDDEYQDSRKIEEITTFGKRFEWLPNAEEVWEKTYHEELREHTRAYSRLKSKKDMSTYVMKAHHRVGLENWIVGLCGIGGVKGKEQASKMVYEGFIRTYEDYCVSREEFSFTSMLQQDPGRTQVYFHSLLELYCHDGHKVHTKNFLRACAREAGDEMISRLRPPDCNWNVQSIEAAISEMATYEVRVLKRLELADYLQVANLRAYVEKEFKTTFLNMFPYENARMTPEEHLAQYLITRASGFSSDGDGILEFPILHHVNTVMKYMREPETFISYLDLWISTFKPTEDIVGNYFFRQFLNMENVKEHVPLDLSERVMWTIMRDRVAFEAVTRRKISLVQVQCTSPIGTAKEDLLYDLVEDSKIFKIVSVPAFCGTRKSLYLRMTSLQLEIMTILLVWRSLSIEDIYSYMLRDDIDEEDSTAKARIDSVIESLIYPFPLILKEPNVEEFEEEQMITVNESLVHEGPYVEIERPVHGSCQLPTNPRYIVDIAICECLKAERQTTFTNLVMHVFEMAIVTLDFIKSRIRILEFRGFLRRVDDEPEMIYYRLATPSSTPDSPGSSSET